MFNTCTSGYYTQDILNFYLKLKLINLKEIYAQYITTLYFKKITYIMYFTNIKYYFLFCLTSVFMEKTVQGHSIKVINIIYLFITILVTR